VFRRERSRSWVLYLGVLVAIQIVTMFWWPNISVQATLVCAFSDFLSRVPSAHDRGRSAEA